MSDDTQLTLATCESIIECGRVDPENIASHFLRWYRAGRIHGMGSTTLKAMRDLSVGTHWAVAGATGEYAAGNGVAELLPLRLSISDIARVCGATGHVVDTVPLALYCAQGIVTETLPTVLERTIAIEGDTDTIASITGQVAGTIAGATGIPDELINEIKGNGELRAIAGEFAEFVANTCSS